MSVLLQLLKRDGYRPSAAGEEANRIKLEAAKEWMGFRWVLSPNYVFNPKHSVETWKKDESLSRTNGKQHPREESPSGEFTIRSTARREFNFLSSDIGH